MRRLILLLIGIFNMVTANLCNSAVRKNVTRCSNNNTCASNYTELVELFCCIENIEVLEDVFFPANKATPSYVAVTYYHEHYNETLQCQQIPLNIQQFIARRKVQEYVNDELCTWVWTDSAVYLLYDPVMLNYYALLTESYFFFIGRQTQAVLKIPEPCNHSAIEQDFVEQIQILTGRLKHLAIGDSMLLSEGRGYSFQLQKPTNAKHKLFRTMGRTSAIIFLTITTIALVPLLTLLTNRHCDKLCTELDGSSLFYSIFLALNIVIGFINTVIIVMTVAIAIGEIAMQAKVLQMTHIVGVIVFQFIAALLTKKVEYFPTRTWCRPNWINFIIQSLVAWNLCVFVQLAIYHSFFIVLAMTSHPIGVACMTTIYIIGIFCLVSIVSLIMLTITLVVKLLRQHKNIKQIRSAIIRIIKGIMIGLTVLGLATLLAAFSLVGENFGEHEAIKMTHPIMATLLLAAGGWLSNKVVKRIWLQEGTQKVSEQNSFQADTIMILDGQYEDSNILTTSYTTFEQSSTL